MQPTIDGSRWLCVGEVGRYLSFLSIKNTTYEIHRLRQKKASFRLALFPVGNQGGAASSINESPTFDVTRALKSSAFYA